MRIFNIVLGLSLVGLLGMSGCGSHDGEVTASVPSAAPNAAGPAPGSKKAEGDALHPVVAIETSLGVIQVTLDREKAPLTVDNFLNYVDKAFYDQTIFHQVFKGYAILGGAFAVDLKEKRADYPIRNEAQRALKNTRGTIAMARTPDTIDSASCQFFINLSDNLHLDYQGDTPATYGYCAFGQVTQGMEVVERIADLEVRDQQLPGGDVLVSIPVEMVTIQAIRRLR